MKRPHSRKPLGPRLTSRSFFWHKRLIAPGAAGEMPPGGGTGAQNAPQKSSEMKAATFLERVWAWVHETFPERQIYIRSDGRVQFFTFGPSLQATLAGLTLIFLGWVAFATVNVIFKDRIIAAKDHRYQQMQQAYESRVADLQISYDELNGALVGAEDRFKATADALQAKQNAIAGFLGRATAAQAAVGIRGAGPAPAPLPPLAMLPAGAQGGSMDVVSPQASADSFDAEGGFSSLTMMPEPAAPQPRTGRPVKASFLDTATQKVAALFQAVGARLHMGVTAPAGTSAAYAQHPALRALTQQTERVAAIGRNDVQLMAQTEKALGMGVTNLRGVMRRTGINPDSFARKISAREGIGGPEIPLDQVRLEGISDPHFTRAYLGAAAVLEQLNGLSTALSHVPLSLPVSAASFDKSSGFGARVDPFTGRYAFHPGIDFAGPWGSRVQATAPGKVVFAGYRGGYGNMVEIDHGLGLHTRYGHLSSIHVRAGAAVAKGMAVGRVGNTGRSTGPHVHYEIWYDNVVKNPNNFIEAGRHVLQKQG